MAFELSTAWRSAGKGHDLYDLVALVVLFEVCYRLFGRLLAKLATVDGFARDPAKRGKLAAEGASYLVSFVHAFVVAVRGAWHLWSLRGAPADAQFEQRPWPSVDRWAAAGAAMEPTNAIFLAFIFYDLAHVLAHYPKLGGADTVAHHSLFAVASYVCGANRVFPFPFAWLAVGEFSTLPLNVRWLLIQSGRGSTGAMATTNWCFAVSFFLCRILAYGLGLFHLFSNWSFVGPLVGRTPYLGLVVALLCAGYLLNLVWFRHIVRMAASGRMAAGKKSS